MNLCKMRNSVGVGKLFQIYKIWRSFDFFIKIIRFKLLHRNDEETNSKGEGEEHDEEHRSPKDGEERPSSSGKYYLDN